MRKRFECWHFNHHQRSDRWGALSRWITAIGGGGKTLARALSSVLQCAAPSTQPGYSGKLWLLVALLAAGTWCSPAQAQLRSGRTQRTLYVDEVRGPTSSREKSAAAANQPAVLSSGGGVRTASGERRLATGQRASNSVMPSENFQRASVSTEVTTAACKDCGEPGAMSLMDGASSMSPVVDSYEPAHVASGCDGYTDCDCGQCGFESLCTSCDSYAEIAPACSSMVCEPGTGPLMWLWCRMSVRAEVPIYWRRAMQTPALVTTSPAGTDADLAGELGRNTTQTLLGGKLSEQANAGARVTLSLPLGSDDYFGLMFRYWNAGEQDEEFNFSSDQFSILARPFLDTSVNPSVANTQLVAFPGDSVGTISVASTSQVDGLDLSLKRLLYMDRFTRVDWLWGYQHVSIDESLQISSNTTVTGNVPGLQGNTIAVTDRFATENSFHGVSYGLMSSRQLACWKIETMFRMGLGNLRRQVNINGSTTTTANGTSLTTNQGLLARNTNDQPFSDDTFVVLPEVGINFAGMIRPGLDFTIGYNYMLVPKVAQAGAQINDNLAVNLSDPLVGALNPALNFRERKYGINSLGLGVQWRY